MWVCDPMHGNTQLGPQQRKRRHLKDILKEIQLVAEVLHQKGDKLGGIHLELTGWLICAAPAYTAQTTTTSCIYTPVHCLLHIHPRRLPAVHTLQTIARYPYTPSTSQLCVHPKLLSVAYTPQLPSSCDYSACTTCCAMLGSSGEDVWECEGGPSIAGAPPLSVPVCDPRLNYLQSIEVAFALGKILKPQNVQNPTTPAS